MNVPAWKRVLDLGLILLTLPLSLVMGLLIALFIRVVSPGPVLFCQERVGYRGRRFRCFKFRSMKVDADTGSHRNHFTELMRSDVPMIKLDTNGDERLIPLASLLRASGLDELPQLINVARGEMSLVGPRPCIPYEYEHYQPWHKRRFEAVPGLTGLWQVSGKNRTTFNEMIQLDIFYAENASFWLDLLIIFKTPPALVSQMERPKAKKFTNIIKETHSLKPI